MFNKIDPILIEGYKQEAIELEEGRSVLEEYAEYLGCKVEDIIIATSEDDVTEEEYKEFKTFANDLQFNHKSKESPFGPLGYSENYVYEVGGIDYIMIYDHGFIGIFTKGE